MRGVSGGLWYSFSRCWGRGQRQYRRKGRTFADFALNLDTPVMELNDPGADGQPKTCTLLCMGSRLIGAIKPVEDPRLIFLRDPYAMIGHGHPCVGLIDRQGDVDGTAWARVFDRVVEKVQE